MSKLINEIGNNIHLHRKRLGISQEHLAEKAGLHRTYIGAVERGERNVSAKSIEKIATALNVKPYRLLEQSSGTVIIPTENEEKACTPSSINSLYLNAKCKLPYGMRVQHVCRAMEDFIDFLGFINLQMYSKGIPRLESFLMPANFSSIVGEYMNMAIPKYCATLARNQYHNGHPDLVPGGMFPENSIQYADEGIEVKGSRHSSGWQAHNPEAVWLMVFHFDSNTSNDIRKSILPKLFCFKGVYAAKLEKSDWNFSGRSSTSRRTITASVNKSGVEKMKSNWLYRQQLE